MSPAKAVVVCVPIAVVVSVAHSQPSVDEIAVSLAIDACVNVDAAEAQRLFALELGTSVPGAVQTDTPDATTIDASCEGELVVLRVRDPLTGKALTRRISLGPKGRERLLALAVMELVVASWIELETTPTPAVPSADTMAAAAKQRRARSIAKRRLTASAPKKTAWLTTTAIGAVSFGSAGFAGGGGIRVSYDGTSGFGWEADMLAHRASDDVPLGSVAIGSVGGSIALHWYLRFGAFYVRTAVGGRFETVTLTGRPNDADAAVGDRIEGMAGGPFARATLGARLVSDLTVELSAEPGFNVLQVHGTVDGARETAIENGWMSGQLAAGWAW